MSGSESDRDAVARAYDRWSESYDADRNATRDLDASVVRRAALPITDRDVVELGCGTGKNTVWLVERARSVAALDFSPGMLERARMRIAARNVRFIEHDIRTAWPLPDESADVIIGNLVLEHVERLGDVYREAARVLRRGGTLFLCELHPERQRRGGQAHFTTRGGTTVHVPAIRHTVPEYVNEGIAAGLRLASIGEWIEAGAASDAPPRLFSACFERP